MFPYPPDDDLKKFTKSLASCVDPERCPSSSPICLLEAGKDLMFHMEIRGSYGKLLGSLKIRVTGDPLSGRLGATGVAWEE